MIPATTAKREPATPVATPRTLELGLFLLIVASPLVFTPFTAHPFADPKLVMLLTGSLLGVLGAARVDQRLALAAGAWVATLALATVLGVDPLWSLLGVPAQGTGLLALTASALLLCVGTGIPEDLRRRLPGWLFWTGVAVSAVAILGRFVDVGGQTWDLGNLSGTLGHRVFVGSFVAAALVAAVTMDPRRPTVLVGLLLLGSALAVTAVRAAWLAVLIGLPLVLWRRRVGRRTIVLFLLPVVVAMAGWTLADTLLPRDGDVGYSAAPRFGELDEGSAAQRVTAWQINLRNWTDDPVLGTGPSTGWGSYVSNASSEELRVAGRGWGDAHNVVLELAQTTGIVGVTTFVALFLLVAWRTRRLQEERAWAAGVAATLLVVHLLQPLNVVLTPLLFLAAGLSAEVGVSSSRLSLRRWWIVLPLAVALLLSLGRFGASSLERYGRIYNSEAALRTSLALDPGRTSTSHALMLRRGLDARAHQSGAAADARALARRTVAQHAWHPAVRLMAADVEALLENPDGARRWVEVHLERFPNDPIALAGAARLALDAGETARARELAEHALEAEPNLGLARSVLDEAAGDPTTSSR